MLFQNFILGVVANIQHILISNAASLNSDLHYDGFNIFGIYQDEFIQDTSLYPISIDVIQRHTSFQNSQSEEDPTSSSEELQVHLDHQDDLVMVDSDEEDSSLDNHSDNQDYMEMVDSNEVESNVIEILIGKKKAAVNAYTPVVLDEYHFMGLEKVLYKISKLLNQSKDEEGSINANNINSSEIKYRYMQRIPKHLNLKDSEEKTHSSENDDHYQIENLSESKETHLPILYKQYPFLNTLHNLTNHGKLKHPTGNIQPKQPPGEQLGVAISTEQKAIDLDDVVNLTNKSSNHDIDSYMKPKNIYQNHEHFLLDQSKYSSSNENHNINFDNQRQNNFFKLNQMAPTHIDEFQAISTQSNEQLFQLEYINSQETNLDNLVPYETFNHLLVKGDRQSHTDGDFILEEIHHLNEPVGMFADNHIFTLDEIETPMEFETKDSQDIILENSQMNDEGALKLGIRDELQTFNNEHIFTLEESASDKSDDVQNFLLGYIALSNLTPLAKQEIIFHDDNPPPYLDGQTFNLETSTSLDDSILVNETPLMLSLSSNENISSSDNRSHVKAKSNSSVDENDLVHQGKEPFIYSLIGNANLINSDEPSNNESESTSSVDSIYQIHVHNEPKIVSLHNNEINVQSGNQLADQIEMDSSEDVDNSMAFNLMKQNEEAKNYKNKNLKLIIKDQQTENHVFHLDHLNENLEVIPVEKILNHYETKNSIKSYYLIKVEKRPDNYKTNTQKQNKSSLALNEKHQLKKQDSLSKDLYSVERFENNSNEDQIVLDNKENTIEHARSTELDIHISDEKVIDDKDSRIFLTLDDVVHVLADKFSNMLKYVE